MKSYILFFLFISIIYGCNGRDENIIKAPGIVEGEIITMKSKVASSIEKIYVNEGDEIKSGDLLAGLDSRVIKNKLKDVELSLEATGINSEKLKKKKILINENLGYLKRQVSRFERLSKKRSISGDDLEKVKIKFLESETAQFELIKSLEGLEVQKKVLENKKEYLGIILEDYTLESGVDGFVMEKFISMGENIFPGMPMFDILDKDSLFIEIFLEEKELPRIRNGGQVRIIVDGAEEKDLTGIVSEIGRKSEFSPRYVISEIERKSLLFKVKIRVKENIGIFKIGMPVTVLIEKSFE
ncbi:MAG: efflux RND transporter periplasmic adaptor subunit [Candidatus Aminicenantes bacterium]|nr:efflux RND transporter periplasmic adaptor subunit [Candidatus Aminicenantes bacterium]